MTTQIIQDNTRKSIYDASLADAVNREIEIEEQRKGIERKIEARQAQDENENVNFFGKEKYIYVPRTKMYVAREKTLFDKTWEETHREIIPKGFVMQTPYQFMCFLTYLKDTKNIPNLSEDGRQYILDNILKIKDDNTNGEWLNAKFVNWTKGRSKNHPITGSDCFDINYVTGIDSNKSLIMKEEELDPCLMENGYTTFDFNKQGLMVQSTGENHYRERNNIIFWPMKDNHVASFSKNGTWASLYCDIPLDRHFPNLGVRVAMEKTQ